MSKKDSNNLVFKTNFDLYPTSKDVDVSFYQELYKFKSVEDYLKSKKRKKKKIKRRKVAFEMICRGVDINLIDSPAGTDGIPTNPGISGANQIGGLADHVTLTPDEEGKDRYNNLNYSVKKDYSEDKKINLEQKINKILNPTNHDAGPIPDGISHLEEEAGSTYDSSGYNGNSYITTDVGTGIHSKDHYPI